MAQRLPTPTLPPRPRLLIPLVILLGLVLGGLGTFVNLYTDFLFFDEVGFTTVFTTVLRTQILMFVLFGALMATIVGANMVIAQRLRPPFRPMSQEQQNLERYRVLIEPRERLLLIAATATIGVFAGLSAAGNYETWLLWRNGTSFGVDDEQFGRDVSYYAFTYPFQRLVLGFLFTAVVLSTIAAAATHYLYGGLRLQTPGEKVLPAARAHLSVLLGLFVLLKAVAYYLDRFGLVFSPRGRVQGASYTDVNAVLPAKNILIVIAIICALLFFANLVVRNFALPIIALALLALSAIVAGGIAPAVVQQVQVRPDEGRAEAPYIERNINATRAAYDLNRVETIRYDAQTDASPAELRADTGTVPNTRLLDPNVLSPTFRQLQQIRGYYGFSPSLDIDRYDLGDGLQDYVVGLREVNLEGLSDQQRNWVNERLAYTHGNGFVAAPSSTTTADGRPVFSVSDIPPEVAEGLQLPITQPRIYYGEQSPEYSVVNTEQPEIDGPAGPDETTQATFNYDGQGGVGIGSLPRRLLFALKYRERNLLLSGALDGDSRIQYVRDPKERVQKVAPFLELDADPYPAVVDGRIIWILDGYTTTDAFPYSQRVSFGEATTDALTAQGTRQPQEQVNYIRNSVKATVDAYDGTVRLYEFDGQDPVLRTWAKVFPGILTPGDQISPELRAHLRYPEDLFKVQRELYARYHVTSPADFFSTEPFWALPRDPSDYDGNPQTDSTAPQLPYYQFLQLPGATAPSFQLTTSFVARNRPNLTAYMAVSSEPGDYGSMRSYELPATSQIDGPGTVGGAFESNEDVASTLTLLRQGGSRVVTGNLLTLPVGGGLLYVQPVYVQAAGGETFPVLRNVIAGFGNQVAFENTLQLALDQLFGPGAVAAPPGGPEATPSPGATPPPGTTPSPVPPGAPSPSPSGTPPADLAAAIAEASAAFEAGQAALAEGDFAEYGVQQDRLEAALAQISQLSPAASPSASGSATPSASPVAVPSP